MKSRLSSGGRGGSTNGRGGGSDGFSSGGGGDQNAAILTQALKEREEKIDELQINLAEASK